MNSNSSKLFTEATLTVCNGPGINKILIHGVHFNLFVLALFHFIHRTKPGCVDMIQFERLECCSYNQNEEIFWCFLFTRTKNHFACKILVQCTKEVTYSICPGKTIFGSLHSHIRCWPLCCRKPKTATGILLLETKSRKSGGNSRKKLILLSK